MQPDALRKHLRNVLTQAGAPAPLAVAVSGGGDSVALLRLLLDAGEAPLVLHVDHGLRADSPEDAAFVKTLAEVHGLAFAQTRVDVRAAHAKQGGNLEALARSLRRSALLGMAKAGGASSLLLAHTQDDQAETVLMQALRGASALRGMRERDRALHRPLLGVSRETLRGYLLAIDQPFREDPHNSLLDFTRVWVREELLPMMETRAPGARARLAALAGVQRDMEAVVVAQAKRRYPELGWEARHAAETTAVDAARLAADPPAVARTVLAELLRQHGIEVDLEKLEWARAHLRDATPARASLGAHHRWRVAYGQIAVVPTEPKPAAPPQALTRAQELPAGVPASLLAAGPLTLRTRARGDRVPLPGGTRLLSDVLIDAKVPREARDGVRLLARGSEVVWVEGVVEATAAGPRLVRDADEGFMRRALALARAAAEAGELPVGAVLVRDGVVLSEAANATIATADPTAHAEVRALRAAAQKAGDWRLGGTTLYVTLEPCPMCFGAILSAHVARVVYAAGNRREGALGGVAHLQHEAWKRKLAVRGGVCAKEAAALVRSFFNQRRQA